MYTHYSSRNVYRYDSGGGGGEAQKDEKLHYVINLLMGAEREVKGREDERKSK